MQLSVSDLTQLASFAMQLDPNPQRLGGRLLGLDPDEQQNVPQWAWWGLGIAAAATAGVLVYRHLKKG